MKGDDASLIMLLVLWLLSRRSIKEAKDDGETFVVIIIVLLFIFSIWLGVKLDPGRVEYIFN